MCAGPACDKQSVFFQSTARNLQFRVMSQYPSPYSPPPSYLSQFGYYAPPQLDLLAPAKRAGLLMMILGGLGVAIGLCMAGAGRIMQSTTMPPEVQSQIQQLETQSGVSFFTVVAISGGILLLFAITMIVLGVFVRQGKMMAIILSIIATSILTLLLGIAVLGGLISAAQQGPQVIIGVCFWGVPLSLSILQLFWLISAARSSPRAAALQQQYQSQYWQYQQNMHAYQNSGYGYPGQPPAAGAPPQLPPSPMYPPSAMTPPPPPPDSTAPASGDSHGPPTQG